MSIYDRIRSEFKLIFNIMSIVNKCMFDSSFYLNLNIKHWDNRQMEDMNNLMAIDYAIRDHVDDTDYLCSRYNSEYPRLSNNYKSKH